MWHYTMTSFDNLLEEVCPKCRPLLEVVLRENAELKKRVSNLEYQPKHQKRRPKKPGRKEGHEGTTRETPKPDETISWELDNCTKCGAVVPQARRVYARIVERIVPARRVVTEYLVHEYECPSCHEIVHKQVPAIGRFDYNVHLMASYLRHKQRMPIRGVAETMSDLCGLEITPATVKDLTERTAGAFEPLYGEIHRHVKNSKVVHGDETGWRLNGVNQWLWVFASQDHAAFHVDPSRGRKVVDDFMSGFDGTFVSDGWCAYNHFEKHQQCWAHVLRNSHKLVDTRTAKKRFGVLNSNGIHDKGHYGARPLHEGLKGLYHDAVEGSACRGELMKRLDGLCEVKRAGKDVKKLIAWLGKNREKLFVFMYNPVVPPDNNHAERLLRHPVVARKIFGGHRSEKGMRMFAIMASVMATWKLQGKSFMEEGWEYLEQRRVAALGS